MLIHSAINLRGVDQINQDPDMLYHQGETIRLINDRLGGLGNQVASNATIITVAQMTHIEVCLLIVMRNQFSGTDVTRVCRSCLVLRVT